MVNTVYSFLLGDNFVSDGVWPFVVARAPRHTIRIKLAVPMRPKYPGPQVVGLGVALCVLSSLVDCTLHQNQVYMV